LSITKKACIVVPARDRRQEDRMGSFDRQPEGWNDYADAAWAPEHVIFCNSKWSARPGRHEHATVAQVAECYAAARDERKGILVGACSWLLEGRYDDGSKYSYPCGAPTRLTDERGSYACTVGHDFVPTEIRMEQGWDYAADEGEAYLLSRAGVLPVAMDGSAF
jgi:hypothetical protein